MSKRSGASLLLSIMILLTVIIVLLDAMKYDSKINTLVETSSGKMVGTTVNRLGKNVNCYFGVPYAEPPVGPRRFSKPIPKTPWTGNNIILNILFFSQSIYLLI